MRLFARRCEYRDLPYAAAAEGLPLLDRLALEQHAARCAECSDAIRNARAVDTALRVGFSRLRDRRAMLAPGRVRLALGPKPVERHPWLRVPALFGRLAEVSVMVGVTLFVVGGSFGEPRTVTPQPRSVIETYFESRPPGDDVIDYFRWLRLHPQPAPVVRDAVRLPAGGLYDVEPLEITTSRTATPR